MRILIQRVSESSVEVEDKIIARIKKGLLLLVGIEDRDTEEDIEWLCKKIVNIRIFDDENGVMNRSVLDIDGEILAVSQFTLQAQVKKGNRPSYIKASKPEKAEPIYDNFCITLGNQLGKIVQKGKFGAEMEVSLINNGPVTIWIDSKNKE